MRDTRIDNALLDKAFEILIDGYINEYHVRMLKSVLDGAPQLATTEMLNRFIRRSVEVEKRTDFAAMIRVLLLKHGAKPSMEMLIRSIENQCEQVVAALVDDKSIEIDDFDIEKLATLAFRESQHVQCAAAILATLYNKRFDLWEIEPKLLLEKTLPIAFSDMSIMVAWLSIQLRLLDAPLAIDCAVSVSYTHLTLPTICSV